MNYSEFQAEDFAVNESFQNWYFQSNQKDYEFWESWISQHPSCQLQIAEASVILGSCRKSFQQTGTINPADSWHRLNELMEEEGARPKAFKIPIKVKHLIWAALLSLIAISSAVWITQKTRQIVHRTAYGEIKSISLPDNSVVTLNSNSKLTYLSSFASEEGDRAVWLEGEAYFSVVPTETLQLFLVYIGEEVVVEVQGTEFNVKSREGNTKVVLNSGKISLKLKDEQEKITMEPGELVAIAQNESNYRKTIVNTDLYTSWKCKLLVFDNTPLREVTDILEENYGLQVEVANDLLLDLKVSGSVPSDNIKLLMEGLSESFGLTIQHTQNHVKIMEKVN